MAKGQLAILGAADIRPSLCLEPVVALNTRIDFFERQLNVQAIEDYDDLDYYKMLVLRSSAGFIFILIEYKRAPVKCTTVELPIAIDDDKVAIKAILHDLELEETAVMWRADDWPERRQMMYRYLRDHGKPEPTL
jgi:hypothetical protein